MSSLPPPTQTAFCSISSLVFYTFHHPLSLSPSALLCSALLCSALLCSARVPVRGCDFAAVAVAVAGEIRWTPTPSVWCGAAMQGGHRREGNPYVNQASFTSQPQSPFSAAPTPTPTASLYPPIHNTDHQGHADVVDAPPQQNQAGGNPNPYVVMGGEGSSHPQRAGSAGVEEHLVTIPGAIVHLVDDQESVFLGNGNFTVVRITQHSQGIVALVRVGDALQWPLMSDEQVVKLDPIHYVFSLPVAHTLDRVAGGKSAAPEPVSAGQGGENMHYGVTFSVPGQEEALKILDEVLESYSFFSLPTLVHGDKQKEAADQGLATSGAAGQVDTRGAAVIPPSVVAGDGKQISEANQRVFWTEMAPSVDDYGNGVAKAVASGAGQIIRGIFWVRDSTVVKLENGAINMTKNSNPTDKPTDMRLSTLRNLQRVKGMTKATDNFAKSVLSGVISTVGIIPNAIAKSRVGRAFFRTGPGEVALASMVSFWKVFDAVEQASRDVLKSGSTAAATVVTHKHGESAGKATEEALGSAGHLVGTAWSVAKVPKALNPTAALKPSKATIMGLQSPKPLQ